MEETFDVDTILTGIRNAALNGTDTERIVSALKDRELLETAVVKGSQGAEDLVAFLERFWTFDSSPYVREKLAHGHRMGRRHCYDMSMWTRMYWKPYFADRKLGDLSKADLKTFSLWLAETKNLKAQDDQQRLGSRHGRPAMGCRKRTHRLQSGCRPGVGSPPSTLLRHRESVRGGVHQCGIVVLVLSLDVRTGLQKRGVKAWLQRHPRYHLHLES